MTGRTDQRQSLLLTHQHIYQAINACWPQLGTVLTPSDKFGPKHPAAFASHALIGSELRATQGFWEHNQPMPLGAPGQNRHSVSVLHQVVKLAQYQLLPLLNGRLLTFLTAGNVSPDNACTFATAPWEQARVLCLCLGAGKTQVG